MGNETNVAGKTGLFASHAKPIVARTWFGRTERKYAEEYLRYNYENGVLEIEKNPGCLGMQQFREIKSEAVEFTTISYWESIEAMEAAHGPERTPTHLARDAEYLLELPETVEVSELLVNKWSPEMKTR